MFGKLASSIKLNKPKKELAFTDRTEVVVTFWTTWLPFENCEFHCRNACKKNWPTWHCPHQKVSNWMKKPAKVQTCHNGSSKSPVPPAPSTKARHSNWISSSIPDTLLILLLWFLWAIAFRYILTCTATVIFAYRSWPKIGVLHCLSRPFVYRFFQCWPRLKKRYVV